MQTTKSGSAPSPSYSAALSNGLTGNSVTYDLASFAGNLTYDGYHHYTYDGEGRLYEVTDQTICYTYDGDGDRVATTNCNESALARDKTRDVFTLFLAIRSRSTGGLRAPAGRGMVKAIRALSRNRLLLLGFPGHAKIEA